MAHQEALRLSAFPAWTEINNVIFNGVQVLPMPSGKGLGLVACEPVTEESEPLMIIPQDLLLSLENVWIFAKSDRHLREALEAVGDYSKVSSRPTSSYWNYRLTLSWPGLDSERGNPYILNTPENTQFMCRK